MSKVYAVPAVSPARYARRTIRQRGVAEEHEESGAGIACVAAPVLAADGTVLAAVSVTGWVTRLDTARFAPAVRTAALGLSRTLR